jgi:hypothetical protein
MAIRQIDSNLLSSVDMSPLQQEFLISLLNICLTKIGGIELVSSSGNHQEMPPNCRLY